LTSSPESHDVPRSHKPAGVLSLEQANTNVTVISDHFQAAPWCQRNPLMTTINPVLHRPRV
jgi:hypothetical protein